jgi:formylglycine-generating enzyme required for sulfatase activity
MAAAICPPMLPDGRISDENWRLAALSAEVLLEAGLDYIARQPRHQHVLERARAWLVALLERGALSPLERARAGQTLARLDDPREGVGLKDGLPDIKWSDLIPAGPFPMGNSKETDPEAYDDEEPRHTEEIVEPYCISVYPITNAQYDAFVEDGCYRNPDYWQEAATDGYWNEGRVRRRYYRRGESGNLETVEEWADAPADFGSPFDLPNHPVVGINWYEAVAFCKWLSEKGNRKVELPTEAQWERAARSTDGRKHPWNGEITPDHANYGMNVGTTTAVGIFPLGAAECGALDMSGNVWEWCRTKWRENYNAPPDDNLSGEAARVLRGGAYFSGPGLVRCAYRGREQSRRRERRPRVPGRCLPIAVGALDSGSLDSVGSGAKPQPRQISEREAAWQNNRCPSLFALSTS